MKAVSNANVVDAMLANTGGESGMGRQRWAPSPWSAPMLLSLNYTTICVPSNFVKLNPSNGSL